MKCLSKGSVLNQMSETSVLSWALTRLGLDDLAITSIDIAVYRAGVNLVGRSSRAVLPLYVQRYGQYVPESRNAQMRTVHCGGRPIMSATVIWKLECTQRECLKSALLLSQRHMNVAKEEPTSLVGTLWWLNADRKGTCP